jgi:hypothetical protein
MPASFTLFRRPAAALMAVALGSLGACGQYIETTRGQSTPLEIAGYVCTYRTDTTTVTNIVVMPVGDDISTQDAIACQNGEDYACGDRDRAACIAHVEAILLQLPKDTPAVEA